MPDGEDILMPIPGIDYLTYEDVNLLLRTQKLWVELVLWMRNLFHSFFENRPQTAIIARVFQQLPLDFFNEFSRHFGPEASQQFLNIFTRLITVNWQMVNAYKENDQAAIDESIVQWYRVADEMAAFLAGVNPYWDEIQIRNMLYEYIQYKIQEIMAFLSGDYEMEMQIFDELKDKVIRISANLAAGIIARHPKRMPLQPPQPQHVYPARQ
jgi:hypothetical protein